eukprot:TRINITY_DN1751_c0_g1_i1.p1 TRINITY_DN1751_c0_g1~~TRINITY_DN1751_c0_g1_i1.p1  ORF type:complete len:458 (-),score=137.08 TRINITY_DN1751_c0_g1_i1:50-1423(-)
MGNRKSRVSYSSCFRRRNSQSRATVLHKTLTFPAMSRQVVTVATTNEQVKMPAVFLAPIRLDIVHHVHRDMAKNKRQPYAVSSKAGMQHSAESWGTGRAVSRIPRVSGGGTHRAGQAAFGNMCRKGRMFAPTKVWRKWHRKIAVNQRRYAAVSSVAASAVPSLVFARGHRIQNVEEVPLVVPNEAESYKTTKQAVALLKKVGAFDDIEKVKDSITVRAGKGKMRNRRFVKRRGPLIVYNKDDGITKAFRNLPGVELCHVKNLNVLTLAPGGHLGRFVVWTKSAFTALDDYFGTFTKFSKHKNGYRLPKPLIQNADLQRLINSEQIQSVVRGPRKQVKLVLKKRNPLKKLSALKLINPYAAYLKTLTKKTHKDNEANKLQNFIARRKKKFAQIRAHKATKKAFYKTYLALAEPAVPKPKKAPEPVVEEKKAEKKADVPAKKPAKAKAPEPEEEDDSLF